MSCETLLFGGSGILGKEILKINPDISAPTHKECDIGQRDQVRRIMYQVSPSVVINCAALVGTKPCEINKELAWRTNVEGEMNVAKACLETGARHIFISSAAIFDGCKGRYSETENPTPTFYYAVTKVAAEQAVKMLPNYAVVRLDFFSTEGLKYARVLVDHYTSKIPASEAAEKIIRVAASGYIGIINIGQDRQSLFDILQPYYPNIEPIKIADSALPNFPRDISLDLKVWDENFK